MSLIQVAPDIWLPDRSLKFASGSATDTVNYGTLGSIEATPLTVVQWVKFPSLTGNRSFWGKANPSSPFQRCEGKLDNGDPTKLRLNFTGTVSLLYRSVTQTIIPNKWLYLATTIDTSLGTGLKIAFFVGGLNQIAGSVPLDASPTEGSGYNSMASYNFQIGVAGAADGADSVIAMTAVFNRVLGIPEIVSLQFNPFSNKGVLLTLPGDNNTGTQWDLSGNGNNGTVTGATQESGPAWDYVKRNMPRRTLFVPPAPTPPVSLPYYNRISIPIGIGL